MCKFEEKFPEKMAKKDDIRLVSKVLNERVKELSCLYQISKISQQTEAGLLQQLKDIIEAVPSGFQYPKEIHVVILLDNTPIQTQKPIQIFSKIERPLIVNNINRGRLEISYKSAHLHFLQEEKQLIDQLKSEVESIIYRQEQIEKEKKIQAQLKKEDRLHILGELTAGIAHELNTPLGNILGFAELLQKSETDTNKIKDIERIIHSAISAREIVKKLMYFSCEMPSNHTLINLNQIISDSFNLLKIQLSEKNIVIHTEFSDQLPFITGDGIQLSQVFINIILNAIAASQEKNNIYIRTHTLDRKVTVTIQDEGHGISPSDMGRLFHPFFTTKENGTGLGLAVTHGIIQGHQGTIDVESELNKGTKFTLQFPIAET